MAAALQTEATKSGLKHLISEMYKAESRAYEKGEGEKPKPIPKGIKKEIKAEEKAPKKGTNSIPSDMRNIVRGFFQQTTGKAAGGKDTKVADLYVGRSRKKEEEPPPKVKRRRRKKG